MKATNIRSRVLTQLIAVAISLLVAADGQPAHADITSVLNNVIGLVNSGVIRGLVTIVIIGMGISLYFGRANWHQFFYVAIGTAMITGAAQIAASLIGN